MYRGFARGGTHDFAKSLGFLLHTAVWRKTTKNTRTCDLLHGRIWNFIQVCVLVFLSLGCNLVLLYELIILLASPALRSRRWKSRYLMKMKLMAVWLWHMRTQWNAYQRSREMRESLFRLFSFITWFVMLLACFIALAIWGDFCQLQNRYRGLATFFAVIKLVSPVLGWHLMVTVFLIFLFCFCFLVFCFLFFLWLFSWFFVSFCGKKNKLNFSFDLSLSTALIFIHRSNFLFLNF